MSRILFLRGAVPTDRDPRQIMYDKIENNCDVWTQLAYKMSEHGYGEIWYRGGKRIVNYSDNFIERWLLDFKNNHHDFNPQIVFARGGFSFYDDVIKKFPNAFKIYYGAGSRITPGIKQYRDFDLILVDSPKQLAIAKEQLPSHNVQLFIKPASDNIFKPVKNEKKIYDIILVGNYNKGVNKGHDFAFSRIPKKFKVLSIGKIPTSIMKKYSNITYQKWIPRKEIPKYYAQSKVAIICCGKKDSCPRIIPEALACNCSVLILDRVNLWKEKYINSLTGMVTTKDKFMKDLIYMIKNYDKFFPYEYYKNNLSLDKSAKMILDLIKNE